MLDTINFYTDLKGDFDAASLNKKNIIGLFITCVFAGAVSNNCSWAESYNTYDIVTKAVKTMIEKYSLTYEDVRALFRIYGFAINKRGDKYQMSQNPSVTTPNIRIELFSKYPIGDIFDVDFVKMTQPFYDASMREDNFDDACITTMNMFIESESMLEFKEYFETVPICEEYHCKYLDYNLDRIARGECSSLNRKCYFLFTGKAI
jgi:hypothetical protein